MDCKLCSYNNPKPTATAVIIKDNKVLLLKRREEPFKGRWDLPGGYLVGREIPKAAILRELKEELLVEPIDVAYLATIAGEAPFEDKKIPIVSTFFLCDIANRPIVINDKENTELKWQDIASLNPQEVAFDSNQKMCEILKKRFVFDSDEVKALIFQLDSSAEFKEQSLYKAMLNGFVAKYRDKGKLMGMGWVFPRTTALRRQAVVEDMIVDESLRGQGIGRRLLKALTEWARGEGIEVLELTTNAKRLAANNLYKSEKFVLHETNHYIKNL